MKRIAGVTAFGAAILLAAMAGCGDDKNPVSPNPQPYLPSSTPQNVLTNLVRAYTNRDSVGYNSLFDAAYAGTSIDQFDPSPTLMTLTKADESEHIGGLARSTVSSIDLTLSPSLLRFYDPGDPAGWATIQNPFITFKIYDNQDVWNIIPPLQGTNFSTFKFAPTTPSPGSPTDTTWHIVRWIETRS